MFYSIFMVSVEHRGNPKSMTVRYYINFMVGLYLAILVWWLSLFISGSKDGILVNFFSAAWTCIVLVFSVISTIGIFKMKRFIRDYNLLTGLVLISFGSLIWCLGNSLWIIYIV